MPMPKQYIKSIYFPLADEKPARGAKRKFGRVVAVAFNTTPENESVYRLMRPLSSEEIREALRVATFEELAKRAEGEGMKPGAWIRERFRREHDRMAAGLKPSQAFKPVSERLRGFREVQQDAALERELTPFRGMAPSIEDSPARVAYILDTYASGCRHVLDPFAGTGNIPIVAGQRGIASGYCEIDPVFRFLSEVKIDLLSRTDEARSRLRDDLGELSLRFAQAVEDREPALWFRNALAEALDGEEAAAGWLASARQLIDDTAGDSPLLARAAAAAVVSARARLERRENLTVGALEAATGEEMRKLAEFTGQEILKSRPAFLCENARELGALPEIGADAVITSTPPILLSDPPDRHLDHLFLGLTTRTSRPRVRREDDVARTLMDSRSRAGFLQSEYGDPRLLRAHENEIRRTIAAVRQRSGEAVALRIARTVVDVELAIEGVTRQLAAAATFIVEIESPEDIDAPSHLGALLKAHGFDQVAAEEFGRRRPTRQQATAAITRSELRVYKREAARSAERRRRAVAVR